ncbi:sulfatase [Novosphingobium flavum]|uniref:Sulfatase n=1 Tax=Novosphingobium flavum TaxID=1778672 RepID=A0A7X1FR25_9SPHN|nr:sulfatase [Novosphingobium flavum]MBC2665406.1 sulfatase [Novosphingobium flavum]
MTSIRPYLRSATVAAGLALALAAPLTPALAGEAVPPSSAHPAPEPQQQRPRNVLLIIADDLAPRLGTYGAPVRTPNIDAFARSGVQFQRAYTQFPWCGPSRASFLTGTRPDTTRVMDLNTPFRRALPDIRTLPEYFRTNGYFTGRIGKIFHQGVPNDIGTGGPDDPPSWTTVVNPRGRDRDAEDGKLKNNTPGIPYGSAMAWLDDDGADAEQTDGKVASAAIDMLRANAGKDRPFFIAVGFYRPHVPLVAPKKYFAPYPVGKMKIAAETPASLAAVPDYTKAWKPDNFGMSARQQQEIVRAYSASTSFMDAQVGRVLAELKRLGRDKDTVVVFTSDHGYLLGEHGQWMKNILWDEADRVPLIIRAPGVTAANARSPRTVEMLDLYPTLTELAGLPHYQRNEGRSLVPLLRQPAAKWDHAALTQIRGGRSVRTERWRYTEWEEGRLGAELYDHDADPKEHSNLAADPRYASVVAELKAKLPKGPVERRTPPLNYDPVHACLAGFPGAARPAGGAAPAAGGGEGGGGLKACERLDP